MRRALLLDLGGTVFSSGVEVLGLYAQEQPAARAVLARRGTLGTEHDAEWHQMLREEITEREYWHRRSDEVGAAVGRDWTIQEFMNELYEHTAERIRPEASTLIDDALAAGVPIGVLTNDLQAFHGETAMAAHPFLTQVEVLVDGSVTGILKPDPRAYAIAAERLCIAPQQIVFVDDMPWNVAGARRAGMIAIELDYTDPGAAFDQARMAVGLDRRAA